MNVHYIFPATEVAFSFGESLLGMVVTSMSPTVPPISVMTTSAFVSFFAERTKRSLISFVICGIT